MRISDWSSDVCSSDLARPLLETARFSGAALDTALGVAFAESGGYVDAVGDLALVDAKWGPSIGLVQIRSLRDRSGERRVGKEWVSTCRSRESPVHLTKTTSKNM